QWEYIVIPPGSFNPGPETSGTPITTTSLTLTGLTPNVNHWVMVRSVCEPGVYSPWVYTAQFTPTCTFPQQFEVTDVTLNSAALTWSAGNSTQWEVIVQLSSAPAPSETSTGTIVASPTFVATGLLSGTPYKFYVRTHCGDIPSLWD